MKQIIFAVVAACFVVQAHAVEKLKNGAPYFAKKDTSLPRSLLLFTFQGGPSALTPEQQGVILVLKEMLQEGPATQSLSQFKQSLFDLGAEIEFGSEANVFEIIVKSPAKEQAKVLALLKQTLESPRSSKEDFERIHSNVTAGLQTQFDNMAWVLRYYGARDFMNYSAQTRTGDTSPASFAKISYDEFLTLLPKILDYQRLFVSYVGAEAPAVTKAQIETVFQDKLQKPYQQWVVEKQWTPKLEKNRYTIINKPSATDNQILFLFPQAVRRDSSDWAVSKIIMDILGGGLHGRLGQTLRVERGLTYGANSSFSSTTLPYWLVWTFGGLEQTKPLLLAVPEVVGKFVKTEITEKELSESKARLVNEYKTDTELPKDQLNEKGWFYANGLSPAYTERYVSDLGKVKLALANKFRSSLQAKVSAVYVMGDKDKVLPMFEAMGVPKADVKVIEVSDIK